MTKDQWLVKLKELHACSVAVKWFETQDSMESAWANCERADWMLWLIGRLDKGEQYRKRLVKVACGCARLSLKYVKEGELRPLKAIETAEAWIRGEATIWQVRTAAEGAYAARAARAAADAAWAAWAADVAYAARAARAARAACAAAYAARAAANAARVSTRKQCADIVREIFPTCPEETKP